MRDAVLAGGIVGLWEWDHHRDTARYCTVAADLLAGDPDLAWRDLAPADAFAGVHAEDAVRLRERLRGVQPAPGDRGEAYRVRPGCAGERRVLCRGRTWHDETGRPLRVTGVVVDLTGIEPDSLTPSDDGDQLDAAAQHAIAAYRTALATGLPSVIQPARALLMAIGREIARGASQAHGRRH